MDTYETQQISDQPTVPGDSVPDRSAATLLRLYVGKNADVFEKIRAAMERQKTLLAQKAPYKERHKNARKAFKLNWCALFLGPVWFFYRKLYIEAAAIILIPVLLIYLMPALANIKIGFGIALGIAANQYYIWRAQKRIAAIEQMPLPTETRDELIQKRGGVSIAGLILGLCVYLAILGFALAHAAQTGSGP